MQTVTKERSPMEQLEHLKRMQERMEWNARRYLRAGNTRKAAKLLRDAEDVSTRRKQLEKDLLTPNTTRPAH